MKTRILLTMALYFAVGALAVAQQQPPKPELQKPAMALPSVDQILDKYVQALGGRAAIEKITSRVAKGAFELPAFGISATIETFSKAPNRNVTIIDVPGFGTVKQGYDGTVAWLDEPQTGLREVTGPELDGVKRNSEFHQPTKLKELYPKLAVTGKQKVADRDAYVVEGAAASGSPVKFYFDVENGLLVKNDQEIESAQGKIAAESYMSDYKEVDGIKLAFTTRRVTTVQEFIIRLQEVKHNTPIEDAKFAKPASK